MKCSVGNVNFYTRWSRLVCCRKGDIHKNETCLCTDDSSASGFELFNKDFQTQMHPFQLGGSGLRGLRDRFIMVKMNVR